MNLTKLKKFSSLLFVVIFNPNDKTFVVVFKNKKEYALIASIKKGKTKYV